MNRFQPFLDNLVDPTQSAYIKGKSILNNFFQDSLYEPILDVFMVFINEHYPFILSIEYELQIYGHLEFKDFSSKSFYPLIILVHDS